MATPESRVRDPVVRWAKRNGVKHQRMSFRPGVRQATPDDQFRFPAPFPHAFVVWVEFKRPGKSPTELQAQRIRELRDDGFRAVWFDNKDRAIAYLDACRLLAERRAA